MKNNNGNGRLPLHFGIEVPQRQRKGPGITGLNSGCKYEKTSARSFQEIKRQSALKRCEKAVGLHPEVAANWFELGKLLLDNGQNQRAEPALREAVSRAPGSANYRYYLGNALGNNGKFAEAAEEFKQLAEIDPELKDPISIIGLSALKDLSYCFLEMGQWKDALIALAPAMPVALSIIEDLAGFLCKGKQYVPAFFLYSGALHFTPGDSGLLHGAGYRCMQVGNLQEALDYLQKARKADPKDPNILYDLGLTMARMKKRKEARPCFQKVLQLDANYFWAWYDLACLDALENKLASAFRKLYKSIERGFRDADYLMEDSDFKSIRKDRRWRLVLDCISDNARAEKPDRAAEE